MRSVVGFLAAVLLLGAPAQAQVINGEGTYEGSSLHTPPPEPSDEHAKDANRRSRETKPPQGEKHGE